MSNQDCTGNNTEVQTMGAKRLNTDTDMDPSFIYQAESSMAMV